MLRSQGRSAAGTYSGDGGGAHGGAGHPLRGVRVTSESLCSHAPHRARRASHARGVGQLMAVGRPASLDGSVSRTPRPLPGPGTPPGPQGSREYRRRRSCPRHASWRGVAGLPRRVSWVAGWKGAREFPQPTSARLPRAGAAPTGRRGEASERSYRRSRGRAIPGQPLTWLKRAREWRGRRPQHTEPGRWRSGRRQEVRAAGVGAGDLGHPLDDGGRAPPAAARCRAVQPRRGRPQGQGPGYMSPALSCQTVPRLTHSARTTLL